VDIGINIIYPSGAFFIGGLIAWCLSRLLVLRQIEGEKTHLQAKVDFNISQYQQKEHELNKLTANYQQLLNKKIELEIILSQEKQKTQEQLKIIEDSKTKLSDTFKALSAEALAQNNQSFLDLAKGTLEKHQEIAKGDLRSRQQAVQNLVDPVKEALTSVDKRIQDLEKARLSAYESLKFQVQGLALSQKELREETANLVKALRSPTIRGRWGEMQLKRVVEMSGMSAHCDFVEQPSFKGDDKRLRPDMIVNLPNNKKIIIDAKAPLSSYLEALEAKDDNTRLQKLRNHARQVKTHINALSNRAYWDQFKNGDTPEFVVLFLPGDTFFTAALEQDPSLIEEGVKKNVILSTPATLIALLHSVAYGWRQEKIAENAKEISELGKELYKRLADMGQHMTRLGNDLSGAIKSYNKTVGTLERRVLPSARRFKELEITPMRSTIATLPQISDTTRSLQAYELITDLEDEEDGQDQ
jgi:DNA recombination protein RmuC